MPFENCIISHIEGRKDLLNLVDSIHSYPNHHHQFCKTPLHIFADLQDVWWRRARLLYKQLLYLLLNLSVTYSTQPQTCILLVWFYFLLLSGISSSGTNVLFFQSTPGDKYHTTAECRVHETSHDK